MSENIKVELVHHIFNPRVKSEHKKPLKWNKQIWYRCNECGVEYKENEDDFYTLCPTCKHDGSIQINARVFLAAFMDIFENNVDQYQADDWLRWLFDMIVRTPNLDWMILTKCPELVNETVERVTGFSESSMWFHGAKNVVMGTAIESNIYMQRVIDLLNIPADRHFLNCEPLMGEVDLTRIKYKNGRYLNALTGVSARELQFNQIIPSSVSIHNNFIGLVIAGGELGSKARPMNVGHVRSLRDQCDTFNVPFYFTQWGEWLPDGQFDSYTGNNKVHPDYKKVKTKTIDEVLYCNIGKEYSGRKLDGISHNGMYK